MTGNQTNHMTSTEPLGDRPVKSLLFKLAIPSITAQIINMLYNIVDRIYIGHMPGEGALALTGLGVTMPIILIVSAFAALVSTGAAPRASIFLGQSDRDRAEATLGNSATLLLIVSAILTPALLIWGRDMLMIFGASDNTIQYAVDYLNIYAIGTVFVQLTLGLNAFITAQGFALEGMLSVAIGALANIILDPIFIYTFGMGVKGAALATILSQGLSCIWVLAFLFGKKSKLRIQIRHLKLRREIALPSIGLGLSTFVMQASESILAISFNYSLLKYGGDIAVGAMTILSSVMSLALLPLTGLGQGAQPITSYNYGAGKAERVRETFILLFKTSLGYSVSLWAVAILFPGVFVRLFTSDPQLTAFAENALRIYMGGMFMLGIQLSCQQTFTALGKARASIIAAVFRKFILLIPLIFILPFIFRGNHTNAVYLAEPISDILAATFTGLLFRKNFKAAMAVLHVAPAKAFKQLNVQPEAAQE